jgi:glutaredoxin 3
LNRCLDGTGAHNEDRPTRGENIVSKPVELYTASHCPYSASAREDLEWRGVEFVEFDVEHDPAARDRMLQLTGGSRTVPVIVEEGKPVQVGWMGRGCVI